MIDQTKDISKKLHPEDYKISPKRSKLFALTGFILLLIGFFTTFDMSHTILNLINKNLKTIKGCNISAGSIHTSLWSLGFYVDDLNIDKKCPSQINALKIQKAYIGFRGPSFSPLGLNLSIEIITKTLGDLTLRPTIGLSSISLLVSDQIIPTEQIIRLLGVNLNLSGKLTLNSQVGMSYRGKIDSGLINLSSKKLLLPSQEIEGFILPSISLSKNNIVASMNKKQEIEIKEMSLGSEKDKAQVMLIGTVNLKQQKMNLTGKINFSPDFKEELPILNILLNNKQKSQGYYNFDLSGSFRRPNFKFQ